MGIAYTINMGYLHSWTTLFLLYADSYITLQFLNICCLTEPQFFRCLWQTLGVQLSKEEADALAEKYDLKKNGQINYKLFCEAIDRHFNPKSVDRNPEAQRNAPLEL